MGGTVGRGGAEPLVSVIMPARNEEKNIGVAIDSIRNQSYKNWELVVVDDYSTDNTGAVVQSFGDRRITLITKTHELPGEATARNVATEFAGGEYITYQDADDSSNERRIERQLACALENPGHLAVGCWIQTELAGQARVVRLPLDHQSITRGFRRMTRRATFVSATMLWPTSVARSFPYRPMFRHMTDWDMLCRVAEANVLELRNVPEALYRYILRSKGSKLQPDWAEANVFLRACQERRRRGVQEWDSIEGFRQHLKKSPLDRFRWGLMRRLLAAKAGREMRALLLDLKAPSGENRAPSALPAGDGEVPRNASS